jgi:hypothetical protein
MNDDGVLFVDSRWFFLLPVAVGALVVGRWVFCHRIPRDRSNKPRHATAALRLAIGRHGNMNTTLAQRQSVPGGGACASVVSHK